MSTPLEAILGNANTLKASRLEATATEGQLPLTPDMLLNEPSGNLFGLTQNVGMGWLPAEAGKDQYLILSTLGGLRAEDGSSIALGYHTGHWEIGLLVRQAAETLKREGALPFAAYCSDPCDGRSQGTPGMFDSLPYRNDAAITMRRLIRSLPQRVAVMGVATCDKGLPATMLALAGTSQFPSIIVPGGVTLPAVGAEDAGRIQTIGTRYAHDLISLEYAAEMGCRACGSPGGGCQFLGTAATSQVVAEAFGMSLPHSALSPSGEPVWLDIAHRSALALKQLVEKNMPLSSILNQKSLENAMLVHAAFGGSTNLLLHIPAIAHAAGLKPPSVADWNRVNQTTPRLVDALPNGPRHHPTVQVYMAGGVPEVMLHLREMGLLHTDVLTVSGEKLDVLLNWWQDSERRTVSRKRLETVNVNPKKVIMSADAARREGLSSTVIFPTGNLAPEGSVIKATAIDPSMVVDGIYKHTAKVKVFTSERSAIAAVKEKRLEAGDILVYIGGGPMGTGMEETAQITAALRYLPWGKTVSVLTDARFSGFSTGACIGHIGPEALAGGPVGKLRDGDVVEIIIDQIHLQGTINFLGADGKTRPEDSAEFLKVRALHPDVKRHPQLPDDTRLWAALQQVSGGTWAGCIYDVDKILEVLGAGLRVVDSSE